MSLVDRFVSRHALRHGAIAAAILSLAGCAHQQASTKDDGWTAEVGHYSIKDTPPAAVVHQVSVRPVVHAPAEPKHHAKPRRVSTAPAKVEVVTPAPRKAPARKIRPAAKSAMVAAPAGVASKAAPKVAAPMAQKSAGIASKSRDNGKELEIAACGTRSDCLVKFRDMIADPEQSWMAKVPSPAEYATGMRLFAYRALIKRLECRKLVQALEEVTTAEQILTSGMIPGMHAEQAKRVGALNSVVKGELQVELKSRC